MASRARLVAPLTLAALSAVAALSMTRLFASDRFVGPVLAAALLPHAIGALARRCRRPGAVTVVGSLVGLAALVLLALVPHAPALPGSDTLGALRSELEAGWHLLRTATAPAPATNGAILLAALAAWCTAAVADWLAFLRRATLGAVAPSLVLFVGTSVLGTTTGRVPLTAAYCAAAAAFLVTRHHALLDERRTWLAPSQPARSHWVGAACALGGCAIVAAIVIAPALPAADSAPLLAFTNRARGGTGARSYQPAVPPFLDVADKLRQAADTELFTVQAASPDYWRIAALDQYSSDGGGAWTLSATGDDVAPGLPDAVPAGSLVQHYRIGTLGERWLPAAYRPVAIDRSDILVVKSSDTLVTDAGSVRGLDYTVASALPPAAGAVTDAEQRATAAALPHDLRAQTTLPSGADIASVRALARQVTAGATTPYARAQALRDFFRDPASGFVYDTGVGAFDGTSAVVQFLQERRGFCVQFATAYALMARSVGIPARVAVGFTPGRLRDGTYHVTSHDAHAWPEVWLAGIGWTHRFDPTPPAGPDTSGGSDLPDVSGSVGVPATPVTPAPAPTTGPAGGQGGPGAPPTTAAGARVSVQPRVHESSLRPWVPAVVAVALLVVLGAGYALVVLGAKARRRTRRREAPEPRASVEGAWEEALDRLREAQVAADPARTPLETAAHVEGPRAPWHHLAQHYTVARYGGRVDLDDARASWTALSEVERALDDQASWLRRWRRRLDPTTLRR